MNAHTHAPNQSASIERLFVSIVALLDQQLGDFEELRLACEAFQHQVDRLLRPNQTSTHSESLAAEASLGENRILPLAAEDPQREQLSGDFRELLLRIQQQQDNLQLRLGQMESELNQVISPPLNLSRFMQLLQTEQQAQIRGRRTALLDKLLAVRSIMVGSHLVLGYRLEFYQQLINALSGQTATGSSCYSADGNCQTSDTGTLIERDC